MKNLIVFSVFFAFAVLAMGCHKNNLNDNECGPGLVKIIGSCYPDKVPYYFFSGYPDFYCLNDSVAVGVRVNPGDQDVIIIKQYAFLAEKGVGSNHLIGGSNSGDNRGEFLDACHERPDEKIRYNTFLVVEDYDKITKDTRELHCRLELRDKQFDNFEPFKILDSARVVLKRAN